jgi:outer membrane protein assembly factor BamB
MTYDPAPPAAPLTLTDVVYLGFNSRVIALDRYTGSVIWQWKAKKGRSSYVAILLDADRLIVSISGYTYGLDALTGEELWFNPLKGFGYGTPTLCSLHGNSGSTAAAAIIAQQHAAAAGAAAGAGS